MFNQNRSIMKRFLFITVLLLFAGVGVVLAQDIPEIPDWQDLYDNYGIYFATYLGVAGIAMFLGEIVIRLLKLSAKWTKVAAVWILAMAISLIGNYVLNVGYLAEATWWETLLWGALSGVAANGFFSGNILFLKSLVEWLIGFLKKEPSS
jgi:hypothetical protein